ncbi:unnamed protein product [Amoebophrya sp. A120]|nr:unnamed protein product [Amoebophrya sp. A120]|eukprot:GSA120T00008447001.1
MSALHKFRAVMSVLPSLMNDLAARWVVPSLGQKNMIKKSSGLIMKRGGGAASASASVGINIPKSSTAGTVRRPHLEATQEEESEEEDDAAGAVHADNAKDAFSTDVGLDPGTSAGDTGSLIGTEAAAMSTAAEDRGEEGQKLFPGRATNQRSPAAGVHRRTSRAVGPGEAIELDDDPVHFLGREQEKAHDPDNELVPEQVQGQQEPHGEVHQDQDGLSSTSCSLCGQEHHQDSHEQPSALHKMLDVAINQVLQNYVVYPLVRGLDTVEEKIIEHSRRSSAQNSPSLSFQHQAPSFFMRTTSAEEDHINSGTNDGKDEDGVAHGAPERDLQHIMPTASTSAAAGGPPTSSNVVPANAQQSQSLLQLKINRNKSAPAGLNQLGKRTLNDGTSGCSPEQQSSCGASNLNDPTETSDSATVTSELTAGVPDLAPDDPLLQALGAASRQELQLAGGGGNSHHHQLVQRGNGHQQPAPATPSNSSTRGATTLMSSMNLSTVLGPRLSALLTMFVEADAADGLELQRSRQETEDRMREMLYAGVRRCGLLPSVEHQPEKDGKNLGQVPVARRQSEPGNMGSALRKQEGEHMVNQKQLLQQSGRGSSSCADVLEQTASRSSSSNQLERRASTGTSAASHLASSVPKSSLTTLPGGAGASKPPLLLHREDNSRDLRTTNKDSAGSVGAGGSVDARTSSSSGKDGTAGAGSSTSAIPLYEQQGRAAANNGGKGNHAGILDESDSFPSNYDADLLFLPASRYKLSLPVIRKMLLTMHALHRRAHLCHDDFSPNSFRIDSEGNPMLISLESAKKIEELQQIALLERCSHLRYSRLRYTAPEKVSEQEAYTELVDVWAFAITIHDWLLAGPEHYGKGPLYSVLQGSPEEVLQQLKQLDSDKHGTLLRQKLSQIRLLIEEHERDYLPIWSFLEPLLVPHDPSNGSTRPTFRKALDIFDEKFGKIVLQMMNNVDEFLEEAASSISGFTNSSSTSRRTAKSVRSSAANSRIGSGPVGCSGAATGTVPHVGATTWGATTGAGPASAKSSAAPSHNHSPLLPGDEAALDDLSWDPLGYGTVQNLEEASGQRIRSRSSSPRKLSPRRVVSVPGGSSALMSNGGGVTSSRGTTTGSSYLTLALPQHHRLHHPYMDENHPLSRQVSPPLQDLPEESESIFDDLDDLPDTCWSRQSSVLTYSDPLAQSSSRQSAADEGSALGSDDALGIRDFLLKTSTSSSSSRGGGHSRSASVPAASATASETMAGTEERREDLPEILNPQDGVVGEDVDMEEDVDRTRQEINEHELQEHDKETTCSSTVQDINSAHYLMPSVHHHLPAPAAEVGAPLRGPLLSEIFGKDVNRSAAGAPPPRVDVDVVPEGTSSTSADSSSSCRHPRLPRDHPEAAGTKACCISWPTTPGTGETQSYDETDDMEQETPVQRLAQDNGTPPAGGPSAGGQDDATTNPKNTDHILATISSRPSSSEQWATSNLKLFRAIFAVLPTWRLTAPSAGDRTSMLDGHQEELQLGTTTGPTVSTGRVSRPANGAGSSTSQRHGALATCTGAAKRQVMLELKDTCKKDPDVLGPFGCGSLFPLEQQDAAITSAAATLSRTILAGFQRSLLRVVPASVQYWLPNFASCGWVSDLDPGNFSSPEENLRLDMLTDHGFFARTASENDVTPEQVRQPEARPHGRAEQDLFLQEPVDELPVEKMQLRPGPHATTQAQTTSTTLAKTKNQSMEAVAPQRSNFLL